ncbi:hypothetical protein BDN70DRAFT_878068 [Pholiota conissans]|uniref:DNA mismatch repair proteins mutS family domain-containing protein n=1 Tax=Pholiota conissans TaxID=109636 RepID=A0A9P6D1W0_9AGAR|nr:hypothetical protein BDN70DRAFT_878068 [Pholiota conissans]
MVLMPSRGTFLLVHFVRLKQSIPPSSHVPYRLYSTNSDVAEPPKEPHATKARKSKRTTKSFLDLPTRYIPSGGIPAQPLSEYMPGVTGDAVVEQVATKAVRKTRKKKDLQIIDSPIDESAEQNDEEISSPQAKVEKTLKPTTFLSRQILANLKRFPHCLLLTRVGQFYESYFDQAVEISRLLNIKLTSRKWNGERVAMCGFPLLHLDKHLKVLVQHEKRFVAMCEEFPRMSTSNIKEFDRRITRIITPGTLIDESFLNPCDNNYILGIMPSVTSVPISVGLAWMDVSTGEFFSKQCTIDNFQDELARIGPREVVLDASFQTAEHPIASLLKDNGCPVSYFDGQVATSNPDEQAQKMRLDSPASGQEEILLPAEESSAIRLLTDFLRANLLDHMPILENPVHEASRQLMQIDSHTIQALEIRENDYEAGVKGSLTSVIRRTVTSGGARLMARWICAPSTSIPEINTRQSLVGIFRDRSHFRMDICELLKEVDDMSRLCQRFLLGRAEFSDLVAVYATIGMWSTLQKRIEQEKAMEGIEHPHAIQTEAWRSLDDLFCQMNDLQSLSQNISNAIIIDSNSSNDINDIDADEYSSTAEDTLMDSESLVSGKADDKKWRINPNCSKKSARLHTVLQDLLRQKEELEQGLRSQFGSPSLSLRSSPGQGFFVHLARAKRDKRKIDLDADFYSIGETLNTKSYFYREWSQLGNKIVEISAALTSAEKEIFESLRLEVIENAEKLRKNAQIIDQIDVAISFAVLAIEMNFVRPEITEDGSYHVVNGRHPTVEIGLLSSGRQFTPNTIHMSDFSNMHIITGPNMAGKSTFLRQTALITILAQVGSFVPADYAQIGVVDKLFSRIGARDDLFRDRSTFMVEMLETADILRRATDRSLVIMDEVGRGTTVKDGLAIAFAAVHHIVTVNKSRCLFATHFHELTDMVGNVDNVQGSSIFQSVRFYCSDVEDTGDGHFAYAYRLRPGINRDSHGLKVAGLADMPPAAMKIASNTLRWLKCKGSDELGLKSNVVSKCTLMNYL